MLNTIASYEAYSLLDGYSRYHQTSIALKDRYKIAFVTNWEDFTLVEIGQNVTTLFMTTCDY